MTPTVKQSLLLGGLILLLGGGAALSHPHRARVEILLYSAPELTLSEALAIESATLWVDARPHEDYARAHVPGAVNLSLATWDEGFGSLLERWRPGQRILVYCGSTTCDQAQAVARRLGQDLRSRDIRVLAGGWDAWRTHAGQTQPQGPATK